MSKRKHNQRKIEKGSLLSLFKKSHPLLADIVSIIVGMCGVLGFALTALALLAPDVLEAATNALSISSEGTFVGFITVFLSFINARDNQPLCIFVIEWSIVLTVFAVTRFRERRTRQSCGDRVKITWNLSFTTPIFVTCMALLLMTDNALGGRGMFGQMASGSVFWVSVSFFSIGAFLVTVARLQLGASWEAGIVLRDRNPDLKVGGLYSIIRHPIYTGLDLMYFASSFLLFSGGMVSFIIACVAVMLNCIRARREERYLAETYGDWRDYRDHTPFMFPKLR